MKIYRLYFGRKLKEARLAADKTQAELAEKALVEPPTVSRWESGKDFPGEEKLSLIIKALGVPADYFDVNIQSNLVSIKDAADFLSDYADAPVDVRQSILWILYQEEAYLENVSRATLSQTIKVLSAVLKSK